MADPHRLIWLRRAEQNRAAQLVYIAQDSPAAAARMLETIDAAVDRLADFPLIGRPGKITGTRELVVVGTPFLVVYRVAPGRVTILRLIHGAQRWPPRGDAS